MVFCFFIIISNNFMEEIEINENYSIDEDAKETLQEKNKRMLVTEAKRMAVY